MVDTLLSTWAQVDTFFANGGTYVSISNPTAADIEPYVSSLTGLQNANIYPELGIFYTNALYALNESIKDIYEEPELIIALDKNNSCLGILFYHSALIDGNKFYWIQMQVQMPDTAATHAITFLLGAIAAKNNINIKFLPDPKVASTPGVRYGIDGTIESETKWGVLTPAQMLAMVDAQKDAVAQTQYFSKVFQDKLSWYLNPPVTSTNLP
jgi:hypothetical protein